MLETVAALCVVLGAIVLLRGALVRFGLAPGGGRAPRSIQVVESVPLGPKQRLHLVEVDGRRLLLGASEQGIARLARLPDEAAAREATIPEVDEAPGARRKPRLTSVLSAWSGWLPLFAFALLAVSAPEAAAQDVAEASPTFSVSIDGATAPDKLSDTLKIVLVLTAISIAPSILLMATCFTRILIVLALLRQALGTATLPPNQVLVGLALMTTVYVMTPVGEVVYEDALKPYMAEEIGGDVAIERGLAPVQDYLLAHTRENDLLLFVEMKGEAIPEAAEDVSISVLMPAFMISELRTAFEIGFMIYLPFLVVDLVIASMLISLGMIMLPPVMIALPFKLMLFVLVDGWNLTLTALVSGLQ
ncbi:MAG: flagellar type III secretion system pore protein FliP [bacterium]|nr:flagellar type III secretion system pore protein FliP [bacterium]